MATNRVYVFAKSQPSPVSYLAEIRSAVEKGGKTISSLQIKMMRRTERQSGQTIKSTIPYIRADIPIVVVFRALDLIPDRDILDRICYDRNDTELFEMMKPCLEDAFPIQSRDVSSASQTLLRGFVCMRAELCELRSHSTLSAVAVPSLPFPATAA